jgi:hypothetical protein
MVTEFHNIDLIVPLNNNPLSKEKPVFLIKIVALGGNKRDDSANIRIHKHPVSIYNSVHSVTMQQDVR